MKRFEINLKSPISASNLAKILNAMDMIHQAEFAFCNNNLPNAADRLYLSMSYGSFKIDAIGKDDGAIGRLLGWLKELIDPNSRKLITQEIKKRDMENKILESEVEILPVQNHFELIDKKLILFDRMIDMSDKMAKLSPHGQYILSELTKSFRDIADANDDGLILSISELRE